MSSGFLRGTGGVSDVAVKHDQALSLLVQFGFAALLGWGFI